MAIKVLLDHGVPQSNIIFLTFLISRRGRFAVHHAFPSVRIVTAAIDDGLEEMHLPLTSVVMGEAAGEADLAVRYVEESENGPTTIADQAYTEDWRSGLDGLGTDGQEAGDGFKMPERRTEELKFSRRKRNDSGREKRAWVVLPGMGHIGLVFCLLRHDTDLLTFAVTVITLLDQGRPIDVILQSCRVASPLTAYVSDLIFKSVSLHVPCQ
jgi:uridine kinase